MVTNKNRLGIFRSMAPVVRKWASTGGGKKLNVLYIFQSIEKLIITLSGSLAAGVLKLDCVCLSVCDCHFYWNWDGAQRLLIIM